MSRNLFINIEFGGRRVRIPEIFENLHVSHASPPQQANIVGLGPVTHASHPAVKTITWNNSQFWKEWMERFEPGGMTPRGYVDWLTEIRASLKPCRLVIESEIETYGQNMLCFIDFPEWEIRHAEMHDIHYTLTFWEHVPHTIQTIAPSLGGGQYTPAAPPRLDERPALGETVTAAAGDSLWKIAQRTSGDGARWRELYAVNQGALHDSGAGALTGMVQAGQVLTLPDSFVRR